MYESKLRYLMADKKINSLSKIIEETGLSRNTLNKFYHSKDLETLSLKVISILCNYFKCSMTDLIEFHLD